MEVNDSYPQLQALYKLYGLLRSHNDGTASDDHIFDENARSFLKNLLDAEVEKLVQAHGEVTDTLLKLTPAAGPMEQENIVTGSLPASREKRCRVCLKSKVKKVEHVEVTNSEDGAQITANVSVDQPRVTTVKRVLGRNESRGPMVKVTIERIDSGKWTKDDDELVPKQSQKNSAYRRFSSAKLSASSSVDSTTNVDVQPAIHHAPPTTGEHGKRYTSKRRGVNGSSKRSKSSNNSGSYASSGSSYGNSNYHSDSEEYLSSSVSTRSLHDTMESSTLSNSETSTTSSNFSEEYGSHVSVDVNSSSGNESQQSYPASASESEMSSASYTSSRRVPKDTRKSGRAALRTTGKKEDGTWRKLKKRLGLKFHHFHHHHHPDGEDEHQKGKSWLSRRAAKAYEKKAEKQIVSLLSSKATVYEKQAVDKIEKSAAKYGKKDKSHFRGLMGAVLSHVHRPKKSKLEENEALHDVIKKKPQWANFTKQALKFRVGKRKPRLKMLPKIK